MHWPIDAARVDHFPPLLAASYYWLLLRLLLLLLLAHIIMILLNTNWSYSVTQSFIHRSVKNSTSHDPLRNQPVWPIKQTAERRQDRCERVLTLNPFAIAGTSLSLHSSEEVRQNERILTLPEQTVQCRHPVLLVYSRFAKEQFHQFRMQVNYSL